MVLTKLEQDGFKLTGVSSLSDIYMCHQSLFQEGNIDTILRNCVLLRSCKNSNTEDKKIVYKNKTTENGIVIAEEKINISCEDLERAKQLFSYLNFKEIVSVKQDLYKIEKGPFNFALQRVEGLGLFLECEGDENYSNLSIEELKGKKEELVRKVRLLNLKFGPNNDIKKAFELIKKNR